MTRPQTHPPIRLSRLGRTMRPIVQPHPSLPPAQAPDNDVEAITLASTTRGVSVLPAREGRVLIPLPSSPAAPGSALVMALRIPENEHVLQQRRAWLAERERRERHLRAKECARRPRALQPD